MSNIIPLGPRTLGAAFGADSNFRAVSDAVGMPMPDYANGQKAFTFWRRKRDGVWGVVIGLYIGRHWKGLTAYGIAPFAKSKAEAKVWAIDFAKQHGFPAMERIRRREPKAKKKPTLTLVDGGRP